MAAVILKTIQNAVVDEREACAKIAEQYTASKWNQLIMVAAGWICDEIRKRG